MLANPPLWLAWPPLEAISCTSSLGLYFVRKRVYIRIASLTYRLAKFPGLSLSAIVKVWLCLTSLVFECVLMM